jgi:hypothetical protein
MIVIVMLRRAIQLRTRPVEPGRGVQREAEAALGDGKHDPVGEVEEDQPERGLVERIGRGAGAEAPGPGEVPERRMHLVDAVIEHVADLRIGEREARHLAVDAVEHAHRVGAQEAGDPVAAREQRHRGDREGDRDQGDDVRVDAQARAQQHQRPDDRRIDPARQQVGRALVVLPEHLPLEALSGRASATTCSQYGSDRRSLST